MRVGQESNNCTRSRRRRSSSSSGKTPPLQGHQAPPGEPPRKSRGHKRAKKVLECDNSGYNNPCDPTPQGHQKRPQNPSPSRVPSPPLTSNKPRAPPLVSRGREPYTKVPGVEDTGYFPRQVGSNWGTLRHVTVLANWAEELEPLEWWAVTQRSDGEWGNKWRGKRRREPSPGRGPSISPQGVSRWMGCDARTTRLQLCPCCCGGLRWTVTHEFCGYGITEEFCREANAVGGLAAWAGAKMVDGPGVAHLVDAKAVVAFEKWSPTSLRVWRRRT